jgi:hypothetical protein
MDGWMRMMRPGKSEPSMAIERRWMESLVGVEVKGTKFKCGTVQAGSSPRPLSWRCRLMQREKVGWHRTCNG